MELVVDCLGGQGVKGSRIQGFKIQGFKIQHSRFNIQGVKDSRFDIQDSRFEVVVKAISFKIRVLVYKFQIHE